MYNITSNVLLVRRPFLTRDRIAKIIITSGNITPAGTKNPKSAMANIGFTADPPHNIHGATAATIGRKTPIPSPQNKLIIAKV